MNSPRTVVGVLVLAAVLWWLYPSRRLGPADGGDGGVVEIKFAGPGGTAVVLADVISAFERQSRLAHEADASHPVYRVVAGQSASRNQTADPTRFLLSVAGHVPPDVIYFDRFAVTEWAGRGAFEPLDAFIDADRRAGIEDYPRQEDYYPVCWDEVVYQGRLYAVPFDVDCRVLFYNEDVLKQTGFVDAQDRALPPRTWQELRRYTVELTQWTVAKPARPAGWDFDRDYTLQLALQRAGSDVKALAGEAARPLSKEESAYAQKLAEWFKRRRLKRVGFAPQFGNSWLYMYGWMNGGRFMTDERTCTLNDAKIVVALQFMQELYDMLGGYANVQAFQSGFGREDLDPFLRGQVAMVIDVSNAMRRYVKHAPDFRFGVSPPPVPAERWAALTDEQGGHDPPLTMSWSGGWSFAIPAAAKQKRAAWEFVRFVTSPQGVRLRTESARQMAMAQGRVYLPLQAPTVAMNEQLFDRYVRDNADLRPWVKAGVKVCNDLLPYSHYRPVTPVGQLLWNAHRTAMEDGLYGGDARQALDSQTQRVQRELDKFFAPPAGAAIDSWHWFFVLYGLIIVATGAVVYFWDTSGAVRRLLGRLLPWTRGHRSVIPGEVPGVVPGARGGYFRSQWKEGWICAAPWIIGFIIFGGGPMLFSIVMSLCDYDVINRPRFVGAENYRLLASDGLFVKSLVNTTFMIVGVPVGMAASLAVAMLLNMKIRGVAVWRTFFYLPAIVPMVASAVLWIWILNPENGLLNQYVLDPLLGLFGRRGPQWLQDTAWSKPAIILMGLWGAGAGMIIWLAGLKGISATLYEAADVDGANAWQRFCHVTLPQLTPYIFFNLVMGLIGTFQIFAQAFIMTQGGPRNSTLFYVYYLFNNAFRYGKMGYASAMAWVLFVIVLVLTVVQLKLSKRWVHYEAD